MELSEFNQIKTNQKADTTRLNFYFNKYKYRVNISLPAVHYFRYCKTSEHVKERLEAERFGFGPDRFERTKLILEIKKRHNLSESVYFDFVSWRAQNTKVKLTVSANNLSCYVHDLDDILGLVHLLPSNTDMQINFVDPVVNFKQKTVYHKYPTHKYRIFFKLHRMELQEVGNFTDFISQHNHTISPALKSEVYHRYRNRTTWTNCVLLMNHHYVDVDHEHDILLWSLRYPDLVRTVHNIEKR